MVDGQNRQAACIWLGIEPRYEEYQGTEADLLNEVMARNVARRHLDESQRAMVAGRLTGLNRGRPGKNANLRILKILEAAELLQVSARLVTMARAVLDSGTPDLVAQVDGGRIAVSAAQKLAARDVSGQARALDSILKGAKPAVVVRQAQRDERMRKLAGRAAAWPQGKYGVIYADPPWPWETWGPEGEAKNPENHYPTMPLDEIGALPVPDLAIDDCGLFLWATGPHLPTALEIMNAWGFKYCSHWVWLKDKPGTGYWSLNRHEILLIGTKGKFPAPAQGDAPAFVLPFPRGGHSEKPSDYAEMIDRIWPGLPKIELFRRGAARQGWDAWGNEVVVQEDASEAEGVNGL